MTEERKHTTVSIPTPLYHNIKRRIEGTGFTSVSDYVTYVLREVLASLEQDDKQQVFSKEEEDRVKDRLRALGYLD
jgi:Arc/MetJ-type ribon-helix-helix transcriptional regulator